MGGNLFIGNERATLNWWIIQYIIHGHYKSGSFHTNIVNIEMGSNSRQGHCLKHIFFDIWMPESAWRKKCMKIGDPQIIMIPQYSDEKAWNINRLCIHLFLLSVNSYDTSLTASATRIYCYIVLLYCYLQGYIFIYAFF